MVISIIALLIGILLPSLGAARDTAQKIKCGAHLRQLGIASLAYSLSNDEFYSSGPFDNRARRNATNLSRGYGPFDEAGWVADFVNGEYAIDIRTGFYGYQDYSDFEPAHGRGKYSLVGRKCYDRTIGNFLFADGHVADFKDINEDKEFGGRREGEYFVFDDFQSDEVFAGDLVAGKLDRRH